MALSMAPTRSDLMLAVWMHAVSCDFRNKGWPVNQDEVDEAVATFRLAEARGINIPSMADACDYYNHG
jgi:shikimate 5-dehydrogenase